MGFCSLPYNAIKMFLVAEEVIKGSRHDRKNLFQWDSIILNLPGTSAYSPLRSWISEMRVDNMLTSDLVCFVDDQRVTLQD